MAKPLTCLLVTIQNAGEVTDIVVTDGRFYIGRSTDCTVAVRSANVSRQHLLVKNKSGKAWIEDQGSSNGTSVNGEALQGKRLIPVNPSDKIMLGSSVGVTIVPIARAMTEAVIQESKIKEDDRESLMNLIQGAHAEAKRLVDSGKEMHDGYIRTAEEAAAAIEKRMSANFEQVMTEATEKAQALIENAQKQHDKILAQIQKDAAQLKETEIERILIAATETAEAKISDAKRQSDEFVAGAKRQCDEYLAMAKEQSESYQAKAKAQSDASLKDAKERSERLIAEATQKSEGLLAESKRQSNESAEDAKRISSDIIAKAHEKSEIDARERRARFEAEMAAEHAESKKKLDADFKVQREKQNHELTQLRLEQLEELKRERASTVAEFARERKKIAEEILNQAEAVALKGISTEAWLPIAKILEESLNSSLDTNPGAEGSEDQISPLVAKVNRQRTRTRILWTLQGFFVGILLWVGGERTTEYVINESSPMGAAVQQEAQRVQKDLEQRKFDPVQDDDWRESYADSVIYTRGFVEKYLAEDFQRHWAKHSQRYFLKKWRVEEDKIVEVIAKLNALVTALNESKRSIHPDFVKKGVQKMKDLETATLLEVKAILGSGVRVEALKSLEKKTYSEFYSERKPATENPAAEENEEETENEVEN